jgi:hypothetical protein
MRIELHHCLLLFAVVIISTFSCSQPQVTPGEREKPVDYVFLIDNSASIPTGESREIAREVLKFFVDFAEVGDKIAIARFDESVSVIVNREIRSDNDRDLIKSCIDNPSTGINFRGQYSDIARGIGFVDSQRSQLFRVGLSSPAVILLSDGKLEPRNAGETRDAYELVCRLMETDLSDIPFHTIGLGTTSIYEDFLPQTTGLYLLKERIAQPTGGRFYHARTVDDLLGIFVNILKSTRLDIEIRENTYGIDIDPAIERLSILAAKRGSIREYCRSNDLVIVDPNSANNKLGNNAGNISWHGSSSFFDQIVIDQPQSGRWTVRNTAGENPPIVCVMKTWLMLQYDVGTLYSENEQKAITAWIFDRRSRNASKDPYTFRAKFDSEDRFDSSFISFQLQPDKDGKFKSEIDETKEGRYRLQLVAENGEHFFRRASAPISVVIEKDVVPFVDVSRLSPYENHLGWGGVQVGTTIDGNKWVVDRPPDVIFHYGPGRKANKMHNDSIALLPRLDSERFNYSATLSLEPGTYSGYYTVSASLKNGERKGIRSRGYQFTVHWWWPWQLLLSLAPCLLLLGVGWLVKKPESVWQSRLWVLLPSAALMAGIFVLWRRDAILPPLRSLSPRSYMLWPVCISGSLRGCTRDSRASCT